MMAPHNRPWRVACHTAGLASGGGVVRRSRCCGHVPPFLSPSQRLLVVEKRYTVPCQSTHSDCSAPHRVKRVHGLELKPEARVFVMHTAPPRSPRVMALAGFTSVYCRADRAAVAHALSSRRTEQSIFTRESLEDRSWNACCDVRQHFECSKVPENRWKKQASIPDQSTFDVASSIVQSIVLWWSCCLKTCP